LGDIWKSLQRLGPVDTASGRVEVAYELDGKNDAQAKRFLPGWALHLLAIPEGAEALVVVSRSLTLTAFYPTRLRCSFAHEDLREGLTPRGLAEALHTHLSAGGCLDDLLACYQDLAAGASVPA
jgi:hypothetical protein